MTQEVVHLRLINSDEVIGELSGTTNNEVLIKQPMLVSEITDDKTKISTIVLSKYVLFDTDQVISFSKEHVITSTKILDEIKDYYYNSIHYNAKFVEPVIKQELSKVNQTMVSILKQSEYEPVLFKRRSRFPLDEHNDGDNGVKFVVPGSNTFH